MANKKKRNSMSARRISKKPVEKPLVVHRLRRPRRKEKSSIQPDTIMKNCVTYHKMKKEFLALFLTTLIIKKGWKYLLQNLDEEDSASSACDPSMVSKASIASKKRGRELTLGMVPEEDNQSETSYQEDWRDEEGDQSDSSGQQ